MIDLELVRKDPERVKRGIASKGANTSLVDDLLELDDEWRRLTSELDNLRAEQNRLSRERAIEEAKQNKEHIKTKEVELKEVERQRVLVWVQIPNPPLDTVPRGESEEQNMVLREVGKRTVFDFMPKDYLTLADPLGMIDMERGAKVAGSRFGFLTGDAVRLEFGIVQLVLQTVSDRSLLRKIIEERRLTLDDAPFVPVVPPVLVNRRSMSGMGYLERGADEVYTLERDGLYLVGTAEQVIGPMHQDEVFEERELPRRYLGFSTCFRREAGSYGKDTKGILRVHQFDKLEMFSITTPAASLHEHELLLGIEEYLMHELKIPYRVLAICTADLGDPAAAKYDIEAWLPGEPSTGSGQGTKGVYRETHSTSNTTDFQARRLNIRYRRHASGATGQRIGYVHMLNGTAFAIGRTLIAIIENYQTKEGRVRVPEVLQKYVGKEFIE